MPSPLHKVNSSSISVDGLEDIFTPEASQTETSKPDPSHPYTSPDRQNFPQANGLSPDHHLRQSQVEAVAIDEAVRVLGLERKDVLKLIYQGKLCATKGKKSREWFICMESISEYLQNPDRQYEECPDLTMGAQPEAELNLVLEAEVEEEEDRARRPFNEFQALLFQFNQATSELKQAQWKIGYLEAKLEEEQRQLLRLTKRQRGGPNAIFTFLKQKLSLANLFCRA